MERDGDRQRLEASLSESEERFRAVFEQAAVGLAQVALDGSWLRVNRRLSDILGYPLNELLLTKFQDITHPDDLDEDLAHVSRLLAGHGDGFAMEKRYIRKDGSVVWANLTVTVVRGPAGEPKYFISVVEDISPRKLAEAATRDAERRYRAIFEATRDGLIINAPDGAIVEANPAACRMHGYTYEEFLKIQTPQIVHSDDLPLFAEFVHVTSAGGEFRCEARDLRKDGSAFPVEVLGTSFTYNGKPHLLGVVRDITERTRSTGRITQMHAFTAALSEAMTSQDVARIAVEQGISALGASAGSLSMLSEDGATVEMVGSIGYPDHMMDRWQKFSLSTAIPLTDAVRTGQIIYLDTANDRLSRYPQLVDVSARQQTRRSACIPLLIGEKAVGVLGLSFDQPGEFSAEDREFMTSLGRQCAQAFERARLFEAEHRARAEAERASRAKDDFLAVLSHELRTPLTPVLLTVSMMQTDPELPPRLSEDLTTIRRNIELESRLISDLLDLTRIAKGKLQLDLQDVDLHLLIRSAIDICQREASARLVIDLKAKRHTVRGDSTRLQQIFWNLLNNAQKFTDSSGTITIRSIDAANDLIRIEVTDTGVGIDESVLPRLFNAFEQGEVRAARQQAGLGLGLAISKRLVEAHGGSIGANSPGRGQGACFIVELPALEILSPQSTPPPPLEKPAASNPLAVLLVEDHEPSLRVLTRLLMHLGHRVTGVTSVASATSAARQSAFDIIISDLGLPDGSGLDLMRQLKDQYAGRAIALTGYGMESDVAASREAGFAEHLIKPVDIQKLQSSIVRVTTTLK